MEPLYIHPLPVSSFVVAFDVKNKYNAVEYYGKRIVMNSKVPEVMKKVTNLHFIGIGGVNMYALALACKKKGYNVTGSDMSAGDFTKKLIDMGIEVHYGHAEENLGDAQAVVYNAAISPDNPEIKAALSKKIPLIYRADLLGYLMSEYRIRIGISGCHGKSTTTSMLSHILIKSGIDPTVMSGAETDEMSGSFRFGDSDVFVYEACEYKNSFLHTNPTVSVILNIDYDHTDYFENIEEITKSFDEFSKLPYVNNEKNPMVILNVDDERLLDMSKELPFSVTFGIYNRDADYVAANFTQKNGYYTFEIHKNGLNEGTIELTVPGKHNMYNALAAYAAADACGVGTEEAIDALSDFEGTKRRFEYVGTYNGSFVYIDYAHHPSEIEAVIAAARNMTKKKVIVVFEPHTYSRTKALYKEFVRVLSHADSVILTDIYPARETDDLGMSSEKMSMDIKGACYAPVYDSAVSMARTEAEKGDVILVLGAGTVYKVGKMIVKED